MTHTDATTRLDGENAGTQAHRHFANLAVSADDENIRLLARHFGYAAGSAAMDHDPIIGAQAPNLGADALAEMLASIDSGT